MNARQYETLELIYSAAGPSGSEVSVDLAAAFSKDGKTLKVSGFYAGDETYKVRFLPMEAGTYTYEVKGLDGKIADAGSFDAAPATEGEHGPVHAEGTHFYYADGKPYYGFGTTVYALANQSDELIDETIETLSKAPFNKIRMCVFPKHYQYNHNEPQHYAFEKTADGKWDPSHPCFAFWDAFEIRLKQIFALGIEVDLILFHPYDRWGFASMPQEDNLIYLDYAMRRFAAFPHLWWSMANEYDLCNAKTMADWYGIEQFIADHDPYHHLLSNHNCFKPYDVSRPNITHMSWQSKQLSRIGEMQQKYGKPVCIDECCYEGTLPEAWGSISGEEMTARFWRTTVTGGTCTHGETFYPDESEIVWWARGGKLIGTSPARIGFLRRVIESLPAPLEKKEGRLEGLRRICGLPEEQIIEILGKDNVDPGFLGFIKAISSLDEVEAERFFAVEAEYEGITADGSAILRYCDIHCYAKDTIELPEGRTYTVDVIDTWNMTRETVETHAAGRVTVDLPGHPWMAILAVAE